MCMYNHGQYILMNMYYLRSRRYAKKVCDTANPASSIGLELLEAERAQQQDESSMEKGSRSVRHTLILESPGFAADHSLVHRLMHAGVES